MASEINLRQFWSEEEFRDLSDGMPDTSTEEDAEGEGSGKAFNYIEQYGVIVICDGEASQQETFNRLTDLGYECKVVTT